jgi:GntR family transcriptional regulator/MocR family aminotransferase
MRTAAPVSFTLDLSGRTGPRPDRVARALVEVIASGQVHDGDRLPSTRTLAATFGLARTAVVGAYEELTAAGFLVARPGGATYIEQGAAAAAQAGAFGVGNDGAPSGTGVSRSTEGSWSTRASRDTGASPGRASRGTGASLSGTSRGTGTSGTGRAGTFGVAEAPPVWSHPAGDGQIVYDLRPGLADAGLIAERDWARALRLAASPARPAPDLREELGGHLRRFRGLAVDPADIFLFPSVSSALRAVAVTCGLAGQPVAFEDPGYAKARLALGEAGAVIRPVPVDDDGIRAEDLRGSDRACYVTPAHQFPLGGRMPVRRRAALLEWAAAGGALVLEDDYDGEFRYDVPPLTPLRAMPAAAGHVVYLGTSSKILSRGLRVSWAVLPARFRAAMTRYLEASGEEVSEVSAAFLASFIASGALTRHHSRAMRTYRARQARFVAACRAHIPAARVLGIEAGLHLTLVFERPLDDVAAVARLAGAGLACLPLSAFYAGTASAGGATESRGAPRSGLICGYSRLPETAAGPAAALIGRVTAELTVP